MLVCNVSDRARRTVSATIAEAVTATDVPRTVGSVFVLLVDEPTATIDTVDALLGEIMLEAASATDTVGIGVSAYAGAVDEAATATDVVALAAGSYSAVLAEAATAADDPDATVPMTLVARSGMVAGVFVNSDGTSREANADGIMVNL